MQTPKARAGSLEVPQRKSPVTPRTARKLKTGPDSDSPKPAASKMLKDKSPKVIERRSPHSPTIEKKRPIKMTELESQIAQLQDDLKKAKDQLNTSESAKRQAQQESEETKKQLVIASTKLEDSQQQLMEINDSEDSRIEELRKISQDRDRSWQAELEAVQKQYQMDSAGLASAMNEIQKLKLQLERVSESEAMQTMHMESARAEIGDLRIELDDTLSLVEELKTELRDFKESEAQAREIVIEIEKDLETANSTVQMLRSDGVKASEAYNSLLVELDESKARVRVMEELVNKLELDLENGKSVKGVDHDLEETQDREMNQVKEELNFTKIEVDCNLEETQDREMNQVKEELNFTKIEVDCNLEETQNIETNQVKDELNVARIEVDQLKSALDFAESRYHEEYIKSTLQIQSAYEQMERIKLDSSQREVELEAELKKTRADLEELRTNLMDKETELMSISEENEGLNLKITRSEEDNELEKQLKNLKTEFDDLHKRFSDKEMDLKTVTEHNTMLLEEIEKIKEERSKVVELAEIARNDEQVALMKIGNLAEEVDKSSRRVERVTEQLDATQLSNTELETELRRLKVQSDQWRKAAEAAAAMLTTGNNGKYVERTGSLDSPLTRKLNSPFSDELEDDSPKKKNGNMLKKIGVLLKKSQKS